MHTSGTPLEARARDPPGRRPSGGGWRRTCSRTRRRTSELVGPMLGPGSVPGSGLDMLREGVERKTDTCAPARCTRGAGGGRGGGGAEGAAEMYLTTPSQRCDLMYLLTMGAFYGLAYLLWACPEAEPDQCTVLDQAPLTVTHSLQTLWSAPVGQRGTTRAVTRPVFSLLFSAM